MNRTSISRRSFMTGMSSTFVAFTFAASAGEASSKRRIAFVRGDFGHANKRKIFLIGVDGTGLRRLTDSDKDIGEDRPTWSPDGRLLAYSGLREGQHRIYFRDLEGRFEQCLTPNANNDQDPCWSPDGKSMAFTRWSDNRTVSHIYTMRSDGTEQRQLTKGLGYDWMGCWTPDSKAVVFESTRDGNREIYRINLDGTGLINLTGHHGTDHAPDVSLVDGRLAFMTGRDFGNAEIGVLDLESGKLANVSNHPARDSEPAWSRNGKWLAFTRSAGNGMDIWIARSDGREARNLTNSQGVDNWAPAWEP